MTKNNVGKSKLTGKEYEINETINRNINRAMDERMGKTRWTDSALLSMIPEDEEISQAAYSKMRNNNQRYSVYDLVRISRALGVSVDDLICDDMQRRPNDKITYKNFARLIFDMCESGRMLLEPCKEEQIAVFDDPESDFLREQLTEEVKKSMNHHSIVFCNWKPVGRSFEDTYIEWGQNGNHNEDNNVLNGYIEFFAKIYPLYVDGQMERETIVDILNSYIDQHFDDDRLME